MPDWLEMLLALAVFLVGMRLSAFFSGSETGFYRLSLPRLGIDARAGDRRAARLLWFSQHPAYFVATCLIGNNVANYLVTAAIGWAVLCLFGRTSEALEVLSTLIMSPVVFQFGELLPKSLYYMTPWSRLRADIPWFNAFYWCFLPVSTPLVLMTRLLERLNGTPHQKSEILLGRNRLVQLVQFGRREGILGDLQSRLANGLLQLAPQSVLGSMIPSSRVLGVSESSSRAEFLEFARKFGVSAVAVHRQRNPQEWYGYSFVAEILASKGEIPVIHPMPDILYSTSKLEALHRLQVLDASYGTVTRGGDIIGVVARNGLVEQLFRPELLSQRSGNP